MKKNALVVFLALSMFWASSVYAGTGATGTTATGTTAAAGTNATATGYVPLVQIPGVPTGEVDISKYLVGVYNFLLSIVGIVAVVMLILGGMKYITAAGSGGAVQGAKQTITDALFGLLLALLSFVIVSTINPDVLYLRQPGAALLAGKDANIGVPPTTKNGTYVENADGTILYTDKEGVTVLLEGGGDFTAEGEMLLLEGGMGGAYTEGQLVGAMNRMVSCISPGSPKGIGDPDYHGKCKCVVGGREIPLSQTTVDAKGGCSEECRKSNLCGYKFLSVKLNARHGYLMPDGSQNGSTDAGAAATTTGGTGTVATTLPEYELTSSTQVHSDEIWEMTQTNDPKWGDFDITFQKDETTQEEKKYAISDSTGSMLVVKRTLYPCAILVTNEEELADDEHWVYWVPLGTVVGGNEFSSLFGDMNGNYMSNCGSGIYGISSGDCEQEWTDRVVLAKYGDDVVDKCKFCNLADEGSIGKAYRWARSLTCRGGYWQ